MRPILRRTVWQPATKASKAAENERTTERTTGEDPRLASYAAAAAKRAASAAVAMETTETLVVPAAGTSSLTKHCIEY